MERAHVWQLGRWSLILVLATELWGTRSESGGLMRHLMRISIYTQPDTPELTVYSLVIWRMKLCFGRAA